MPDDLEQTNPTNEQKPEQSTEDSQRPPEISPDPETQGSSTRSANKPEHSFRKDPWKKWFGK